MTCDILLDWLTFSGHFLNFDLCLKFLGIRDYKDEFTVCPGRWFYSTGLTYQNWITVYIGMKGDCTAACVNVSGRGCRFLEANSERTIYDILNDVNKLSDFNLSRADIALDAIGNNLSILQMIDDTRNGNFTCRSKFYNIMESCNDGVPGYSIYFGKKGSNIFINIYDKRGERGFSAEDCDNWTRIEIRLRHENAQGFLKSYINQGCDNIGYLYFGILNRYLRFLKPSENDTNKSRWHNADYWDMLLQHEDEIKVFSQPGVEYDYSKFEDNFFRQSGSGIATYLKLHSVIDLQNEIALRQIEPNARQQFIIDNYVPGEVYKEL